MDLTSFLGRLDLNSYEKEVILYLSSVEEATAREVYAHTKVPQGRIYSVLQSLQHKNIVDLIASSPKKYGIKNVKDALQNYLHQQQQELEEKAAQIQEIQLHPKQLHLDHKPSSAKVFVGREEHLNAVAGLRNSARKELWQIAPSFIGNFASALSLQRALQRGVKVKVLIKEATESNKKMIRACLENGGEVRVATDFPNGLILLIKDREEFLLGVQNYTQAEERMILYSRNEGLLKALEDTFVKLWKKSKPVLSRN